MQSNREGGMGAAFVACTQERFQFLLFMLCYFPPLTLLCCSCWNTTHTHSRRRSGSHKKEKREKEKMSKQNYFFFLPSRSFPSTPTPQLHSQEIPNELWCRWCVNYFILYCSVSSSRISISVRAVILLSAGWTMALSRHLSAPFRY